MIDKEQILWCLAPRVDHRGAVLDDKLFCEMGLGCMYTCMYK